MPCIFEYRQSYYNCPTLSRYPNRFGQFAGNRLILGATDAAGNKLFFQMAVNDSQEQAPTFAPLAEPSKQSQEAEMVLSSHPIKDLWEKGHPDGQLMQIRNRWLWIDEVLRHSPQEKYFPFDPGRSAHEVLARHPIPFAVGDFDDRDWYRSSAEMVRQGVSLLNRYYSDAMAGRFDPTRPLSEAQVQLILSIIECLGGVLGLLPMLRPVIPEAKRSRLIYLMNEKLKQDFEKEKRDKIQVLRNEILRLKDEVANAPDPGRGMDDTTFRTLRHQAAFSSHYGTYASARRQLDNIKYHHVWLREQGTRQEALWQQLQELEKTQSPTFHRMPSSPLSPKDIQEILSIASHQAGMSMSEVEQLIEWEAYAFTRGETDALAAGTHLRRDTVIPQWFQASKAAAASDGHAVHC